MYPTNHTTSASRTLWSREIAVRRLRSAPGIVHYWHSEAESAKETIVPTYQYACTSCGHQLEAVQSFADEPLSECPSCEGRLRKLFSGVGVVFKGSGFYRTDSRSESRNGSSSDGSGKSATSSESKPSSESKSSESKSSESKSSGSKPSDSKSSASKPSSSTSTGSTTSG